MNIIDVEREIYDNGISGYCITPSGKADKSIAKEEEPLQKYRGSIQNMLTLFGDKSAKDLELLTTIIYIYSNYQSNRWNIEEALKNVHEINPHFDIERINAEYERLNSLGILEKAIA
jgi:hypothetical protein